MRKFLSFAMFVLAFFMLAGCSSKTDDFAKDNLYKAFEYLLEYEGQYLDIESVKYLSVEGKVEGETFISVFYYITYKIEGYPTRYYIEIIIDREDGEDDIYHYEYDSKSELDEEYEDTVDFMKEIKTDYTEYNIKYSNGTLSSSVIKKAYDKAK